MQQLIDTLTMSSREIAELCEKEHRNVMRDIRIMLVELYGEGGVLSFEHTHRNPQNGQQYPIFQLPKDLTLTLVSGYNVKLRKRIIDRWLELENAQRQPATDTQLLQQTLAALQPLLAALAQLATPASLPPVMLPPPPAANPSRLHGVRQYVKLRDEDWEYILDMVESGRESGAQLAREYGISSSTICRRLAMRQQRQRASQTPRPSVQAAYSVTDAAKMLNQSPRRLFKWLAENRWIYRRSAGSPWTAYQDKLENGWLQVRLLDIPHSDGSPRDVQQVQVTTAGLVRLENLLQAVA